MFNVSTHKHHLPEYSVNLLHTVELSRKYLHKTQITLCNTLHNVPNPPPKECNISCVRRCSVRNKCFVVLFGGVYHLHPWKMSTWVMNKSK